MRKIINLLTAVTLCWGLCAQVSADDMTVGQSCTSIMVGKRASADGSVITSHTCDGRYRTWMNIEPAADHPAGTMHPVYKGTMHTAYKGDTTGVRLLGEIPEAPHTFAYLNTAYPCLNEHQLAIGESTFGGPDTLQSDAGIFYVEELERVALQRCTTARDAIRTIGELIAQYGYADGGECLTIADRDEVWQMEIIGPGKGERGGVWVAKRVPDDAVAVACNIPRIGTLERESTDFLCSDNVEAIARRYNLWDGQEPFVFWRAYNCDYAKGRNFLEREYYILSQIAPKENLSFDASELPFCVVPERKLNARDVMLLLRATYEGTEHDMCRNIKAPVKKKNADGTFYTDTVVSPIANPWMGGAMRNTLNLLQPGTVEFHRGVSVAWCSYSFVAVLRSWLPDEVGGLVWMACDNPAESPRIPIFCGTTRLPKAFSICGHHGYNENAWLWQYRKANKLATVAWQSTKDKINQAVADEEESAFKNLYKLEQELKNTDNATRRTDMINGFTQQVYDQTAYRWAHLERALWEQFGFGF